MTNKKPDGHTIGKLGELFFAGLQRLYAAHVEKVQMRFAPIRCESRVQHRSYFGRARALPANIPFLGA